MLLPVKQDGALFRRSNEERSAQAAAWIPLFGSDIIFASHRALSGEAPLDGDSISKPNIPRTAADIKETMNQDIFIRIGDWRIAGEDELRSE